MIKLLIAIISALGLQAGILNVSQVTITDGDTIKTPQGSIRFLYIDTPEKFTGAKLNKDSVRSGVPKATIKEMGLMATDHLRGIMALPVHVESNASDMYGRALGVVHSNALNVNLQMVEDGYACAYRKASTPRAYYDAELRAKVNKTGLWLSNRDAMSKLCK